MELVTHRVTEWAPVQYEGTINGYPFYFRARGDEWTFRVAKTSERATVGGPAALFELDGRYAPPVEQAPSDAGLLTRYDEQLIAESARAFLDRLPTLEPPGGVLGVAGWIEVQFGTRWFGIVKLLNLLEDPDPLVIRQLFGKDLADVGLGGGSRARGLPDDASEEAKREHAEDQADSTLDVRWETWIDFDELLNLPPVSPATDSDAGSTPLVRSQPQTAHGEWANRRIGWGVVADLAGALVEKYGPRRVRIVAWLW